MTTLAHLKPGDSAEVTELLGDDPIAIRLYEMGLLPGERVVMLGKAPLGDPIAIRVRGCRLALRRREAERVQIRRLQASAEVQVLPLAGVAAPSAS